jgi:G8 domain
MLLSIAPMDIAVAALSTSSLRGMGNSALPFVDTNSTFGTGIASGNMRRLQDDGMKDFLTLTCNANLASASCQKWTVKIGTSNTYTNLVIVPCGECITMDYIGSSTLNLLGGIDIQGRLVFPDGYKVNVTTPMIIVQGELIMTATKPVDGIPNIKISMIGQDEKQSFTPIDSNAKACNFGAATCIVGKKAIVVAGGKVNSKFMSFITMSMYMFL